MECSGRSRSAGGDGAFGRLWGNRCFSALGACESGAEATAVQTLREIQISQNLAERLDCVRVHRRFLLAMRQCRNGAYK
jgi:hypothetical protein